MSRRTLKWLVLFTLLLTAGAILTLARHTGTIPADETKMSRLSSPL